MLTVVVTAFLLALPLAGLALFLARPELDVRWEHHPSHFWLVLGAALVNVGLGVATNEAARHRADARLFLVSLTLLTSAGFLGLHALATPGVLLEGPNAGFVAATPVGLLLSAGFAAASSGSLQGRFGRTVMRRQAPIRAALAALLGGWAVASLAGAPLLQNPVAFDETPVLVGILLPLGVLLYGVAAFRYANLYRRRRRTLPLAVTVAFILLAEALVSVAFGRSWHASWWEWHVLMAVAFGSITLGARVEHRRLGSLGGAFGGLYLDWTLERIDRRHSDALRELVLALQNSQALGPLLEVLRKEGFSADETMVLERSARELHRIDELFRPYVAPQLAEKLLSEPELVDLAGFTTFSESRTPTEIIQMLNTYWSRVVPILAGREGGVIERFAGDGVLVLFNAFGDQPDHPLRAVRGAVDVRAQTERVAAEHPDWPRFRIGVNTGSAVVGHVGAGEQRAFTAIGDTTNVAARLQAAADPGQVLIGPTTKERIADAASVRPLGPLSLKGKREPVDAYQVIAVEGAPRA
jgi:class 3 adenylate cyclase